VPRFTSGQQTWSDPTRSDRTAPGLVKVDVGGPGPAGPRSAMSSPASPVSVRPGRQPAWLSRGEVHAWVVDLDSRATCSLQSLNTAERDRAGRYLSPRDGARFAASRAALRAILGGYLSVSPADLRFGIRPGGRPVLAAPGSAALEFSLARTAGLGLIAVSLGPVGADIEEIRLHPGLAELAAARFGPAEAACIAGGCGGTALTSFYRHWTAKEAYLKAVGVGLAGLAHTAVDCSPRPVIRFRGSPVSGLRLCLPDVSAGIAAAIVSGGPVAGCWQLGC
jgi:phosphopantetheinyl transferase